MTLPLLIVALTAAGWFIAAPLFEFVVGMLLAAPCIWFLCAKLSAVCGVSIEHGLSAQVSYLVCLWALWGASYLIFGRRTEKLKFSELYPIVFLVLCFCAALALCLQWPDFAAMGERLRDYSILASTIQSPIIPREPWMEGAVLNYYVYWYRFGAMLSALLGMPMWWVYHTLVAFAISLYIAVIFQIVRVVFGVSTWWAAVSALVVGCGSNFAGLRLWRRLEGGGFGPDDGWWGPSRIVAGAINEFPAWSFLLGDAHPHYLNLAAIPFLVLLLYRIVSHSSATIIKAGHISALVATGALFLYGSNAWEVPMWIGVAGLIVGLWILNLRKGSELSGGVTSFFLNRVPSAPMRSLLIAGAVWALLLVSLFLCSRHLVPEGGDIKLVKGAIAVTTTMELLVHWGFHLAVVVSALIIIFANRSALSVVLFAALLVPALLYDKAALVVFLLLGAQVVRALREDGALPSQKRVARLFSDGLLLAGLGLLLLPEIVFLDDPYGGENERMNTIFKVYSTAWGVLALGAIGLLHEAWSSCYGDSGVCKKGYLIPVRCLVSAVVLACALRFFTHTVSLRRSAATGITAAEGLAAVEVQHPGSAETIRALRELPQGVVLETQGNAYSYTSFVSTLAAQPSYLGWANHVNLLTKNYAEVSRRERITQEIYRESDCHRRRELVQREGIRYVIVGDLEQKEHPGIKALDFSCFTQVAGQDRYLVFGP